MNIKKSLLSLFFALTTADLIHASTLSLPKYSEGHWLVAGDVGALWPQINTTTSVANGSGFPSTASFDEYTAYSNRDEGMLAAAAGYSWQMNANVVSAYTKLDLIQKNNVLLYVDLGLGAAFVDAQHYSEAALSGVTARQSPAFANRTSTQFSYNVGTGIDYSLASQMILSLGYDYQSFDNVVSGVGQSSWSGTELTLSNWGMHSILLSFSYLFDLGATSGNMKA